MSLMKVLAIDLGASSGRVMQAVYNGSSLQLSEVHRFKNEPVNLNDGLYWNLLHLFGEIKQGIKKASNDSIPIRSISVDTWGVDYAYLDHNGDLLYQPHCYRDNRMGRYEESFYQLISKNELFKKTGVQPATYNTILQIYSDLQEKPQLKQVVQRVLFIPDLINYLLAGVLANEYTIASTSGLLDVFTQDFSEEIFEKLEIPTKWFSKPVKNGSVLRDLSPRIVQELKVEPFKVIAGAGHDTAAAVLAIPYENEKGTVFISCGTWSLVGIESDKPIITDEAFESGLTNEGCFDGKYRLLQNTTGMWIIQELQRDWRSQGEEVSFAEMVQLAEKVTDNHTWIYPNDPVFASPGDMESKIKEFCKVTGQAVPQTKGHIVRIVIESLALTYLETIEQLEDLTKQKMTTVQMVGGGIQNKLLCQITANFTNRLVITGPVEASALGNILSQLLTLEVIHSRQEAQNLIKASEVVTRYEPQAVEGFSNIQQKFKQIKKGISSC